MKILLVFTFFLQVYASDLDVSVLIFNRNIKLIGDVNNTFNLNNQDEVREVLAIVAPEITRWGPFSNYLETKALEALYISKGHKACDFSIGYFQMKPSFIEDLEDFIKDNSLYFDYLNFLLISNILTQK